MHKVTYLHMQVVMIGARGAAFMPQEHRMKFMFITHPIRKSSLKISDNLSYRITCFSGEIVLLLVCVPSHKCSQCTLCLKTRMTCMTSQTRVWHGSGWVSSYVKRVLDWKTWTLNFASRVFSQRTHRSNN